MACCRDILVCVGFWTVNERGATRTRDFQLLLAELYTSYGTLGITCQTIFTLLFLSRLVLFFLLDKVYVFRAERLSFKFDGFLLNGNDNVLPWIFCFLFTWGNPTLKLFQGYRSWYKAQPTKAESHGFESHLVHYRSKSHTHQNISAASHSLLSVEEEHSFLVRFSFCWLSFIPATVPLE